MSDRRAESVQGRRGNPRDQELERVEEPGTTTGRTNPVGNDTPRPPVQKNGRMGVNPVDLNEENSDSDGSDLDEEEEVDDRSFGELTTESSTPTQTEGEESDDEQDITPVDGELEVSEIEESVPIPIRASLFDRLEVFLGGRIGGEEPTGRVGYLSLALIFLTSVVSLIGVYQTLPQFEESEKPYIRFPMNMDDAKALGDILSRYTDNYYFQVLSGVCVSYIFLQTFAIPGSIFLSILSGFLFSFPVALLLICFCSATGASFCYLLSYLSGRRIIYRFFPQRVQEWSETVQRHKNNLLNYIIFLRVTPLIPNWFINITAPVLDVPLLQFWLGTFIGVGPPSVVAIQAGTTLHDLASANDAVSWQSVIILLLVGVVSLVPIIMKDMLKNYFG